MVQPSLICGAFAVESCVVGQVDRVRSDSSNTGDEMQDLQGTTSLGHLILCAEDAMLPTARTCSQQLRLPSYSSREQLGIMLRVALKHGAEGFGME